MSVDKGGSMSNAQEPKRNAWSVRLQLATVAAACVLAVAGCASSGKMAIPEGADEVEAGSGSIDWEAGRDGEVWVYDADSDKMIYSGPVREGQSVRVNAGSDQVTIGGRTVSERPISDEHRYRIYFRRD
jgi:hypothetical protein